MRDVVPSEQSRSADCTLEELVPAVPYQGVIVLVLLLLTITTTILLWRRRSEA